MFTEVLTSLMTTVSQALAALIMVAVIFLIRWVIGYLQGLNAKIKNDDWRAALDQALREAETVATDAVKFSNQTYVNDIKKSAEDGKLTKEEQQEAMNRALNYFLTHITKGTADILANSINVGIDKWAEGMIEKKVSEVKAENAKVVVQLADPK